MVKRMLIVYFLLTILTFGCQGQSTSSTKGDDFIKSGPDIRARIVAIFKKGTTAKEIFNFDRTVIGVPNPVGTGYHSLPGIRTVVGVFVQGFDGVAINFQPDASEEEISFVKKRIVDSFLVFRVYENVIPD